MSDLLDELDTLEGLGDEARLQRRCEDILGRLGDDASDDRELVRAFLLRSQIASRQWADAAATAHAMSASQPGNQAYRGAYAECLIELGRYEEALVESERLLAAEPRVAYYSLQAELLDRLGRAGDAERARSLASKQARTWLAAIASRNPTLAGFFAEGPPDPRRRLWPQRRRQVAG
jgi:thioredoxin-like negative regulator of GroEL